MCMPRSTVDHACSLSAPPDYRRDTAHNRQRSTQVIPALPPDKSPPVLCTVQQSSRRMKLLTHNMLSCHIKGVKNGYPFKIEATKVEERDTDFDPDFLRHMFPRLEWHALVEGAQALGCSEGLPEQVTPDMLEDDAFLKAFHHALLEVHLEEGALICPETGRRFLVQKGIPNLVLNETEI